MSVNERFNLFWLTRALSIACQYDLEHYYYDTIHRNLFSIVHLSSEYIVLDKYNSRCDELTTSDIIVRLTVMDEGLNSIIEIPRLSVKDKKEIQFQFLSLLSDKVHHAECLLAVSEQADEDGFILDNLLQRRPTLVEIAAHWETLKLRLSFGYMNMLSKTLNEFNFLYNF